jgi:hypothetical protein
MFAWHLPLGGEKDQPDRARRFAQTSLIILSRITSRGRRKILPGGVFRGISQTADQEIDLSSRNSFDSFM